MAARPLPLRLQLRLRKAFEPWTVSMAFATLPEESVPHTESVRLRR